MSVLINEYELDGYIVKEYDTHTTREIKVSIVDEPPQEVQEPLTLEEMQAQILLNTEYLVSRTELGLGGI